MTGKSNANASHSTSSQQYIIRDLTISSCYAICFLKKIFAISREENLADSLGLRDGGTRTSVQTTEHICPITQTQLMSWQKEQALNDTAAQEFAAVRFR